MSAFPVAQPEYRALMMYDHVPDGCILHLVTDNKSYPHIRPGEFVVVDTLDRKVRHLETYVIEWNGGGRDVCEAVSRQFNFSDPTIPRRGWIVRSISGLRGKAIVEAFDHMQSGIAVPDIQLFGWSEGPFRSDDGHLESKLVGCVIGLYQAPATNAVMP